MNQHKVQVFHDVVKMIKKPRVIQAQNLYSYRVVAQSSPFSGALAMQKVSRSKTVFSDAFKEYNDPYKFLQVLKGRIFLHRSIISTSLTLPMKYLTSMEVLRPVENVPSIICFKNCQME